MILSHTNVLASIGFALSALTSGVQAQSTAPSSSSSSISSTPTSTSSLAPGTACNNSPNLCAQSYSNITHMGAHDSSFVRDASTGYSPFGNQFFNVTVALSAGIRLLQGQVHNENGTLKLCHTSCDLLDAGTLEDWLSKIKFWMDDNPNEVVTLLLVNSDNVAASSYGSVFESSGISTYGHIHTSPSTASVSSWPTLGEMISSNKRLITFIASVEYSTTYPYLLNEFAHVFETPYQNYGLSNFTCNLDRPSSMGTARAAISGAMMPLMNHFSYKKYSDSIDVPNVSDIDTTNSPSTSTTGALGQHADSCVSAWGAGIKPVFMLVDFYDKGPAIDTADRLNGVTNPVGRKSSQEAAGSSVGMKVKLGGGGLTVALVAFWGAALIA
ncbi:PLC-like phosphodiesterase, TIM beta/alpha-barrel-containing domain containing protein [Rhypophila decipiens]